MAIVHSDAFNYSDGGLDLVSSWVKLTTNCFDVSSSHLVSDAGATGVDQSAVWTADTWPDDQYAQVAVSTLQAGGTGSGVGVILRAADSANYYRIVVNADASNNIEIAKRISNVVTAIDHRTQAFSDGDTLKAQVVGNTIKVYRNGAQIGADITGDGALASGDAGVFYSSEMTTAWTIDNFEGGDAATSVQTLAPNADSVDGAWTNEAGNNTNLFESINEATASDSDYIQSEFSPGSSGSRVKLQTGGDPASSTGHEINWRIAKNANSGQTIDMIVKLYEGGGDSLGGGTLIGTFLRSNVSTSFTEYAEALSAGQADSITNYGSLYLEFFANATIPG